MNSQSDQQLLQDYTAGRCEAAFAELVRRHVDLVYSAALRMVRDAHLAEDVTQGAFVALAQNARQLTDRPALSGWLHRTAQNLAAKTVRSDVRRRAREQEAAAMNELSSAEPEAIWEHIAPHLDAALDALSEADRDALMLRYFERKSAQEMAQRLGVTDEAAQRRVSRAVERLREYFAQRGVTIGASGLVVVISANAVQAAPVGLALTISTAAVLSGTTLITTSIATATKTIAMTTLQKSLVATALVATIGAGIYEARQAAGLREQNGSLQRQQALLNEQIQQVQRERDTATSRSAALSTAVAQEQKTPAELMKLRGQVGVLRQEKADIGSKSGLSKVTADPEARKVMREQQKTGMSSIYSGLAKRLKWSPEVTGQFNDLLADGIMESIDLITQSLHDKKSRGEIDQLFSVQELALQDKVSAIVGPEGLAQYREYSRDIASTITAAQFETSLTGDQAAKADKKQQLLLAMREETRAALVTAGLPEDFQTLPTLNFRNIASEEQAELGLKLMDGTFERVATRASSFFDAEELKKFQEFRAKALENTRAMLLMNRKLMAPISQ